MKKLTPEQEALIPIYRDKWRRVALSTGPIDRQQATIAVKAAYAALGKKEPEIVFLDTPYAALTHVILKQLHSPLWSQMWSLVWGDLRNPGWNLVWNQLWKQLTRKLNSQLSAELIWHLEGHLWSDLGNRLSTLLRILVEDKVTNQILLRKRVYVKDIDLKILLEYCIQPELWAGYGSRFDFCISVLNCHHDQQKWEAFQSLVKYCGWIFPFAGTCIVCDPEGTRFAARPKKLSLDSQNRLHAEGEPAIQFADGYSLYSYHGVSLPEKYWVHPHQWQGQWLLEENNAELRRVLIQGIGYGRVCQELQAEELDSWQEYTLLIINNIIDFEPIYLLKMTCPSTGFIHAMRVPPDMRSAREAIRWVNWGTDPDEFAVQT